MRLSDQLVTAFYIYGTLLEKIQFKSRVFASVIYLRERDKHVCNEMMNAPGRAVALENKISISAEHANME